MLVKFKNWFLSFFKKEEKKQLWLVPPYRMLTFTTYEADIKLIFTDNSYITKKYRTTITDPNDTDCPVMKYIANTFKQGYFTVVVGADVRSFNTHNIKEISYNPRITTEQVKEEIKVC